jgi:plastocyanin
MFPTKEMGMGWTPLSRRAVLGAAVCGLGAAVLAPGALGATAQVREGDGAESLLTEFNAFYPKNITVRQGDKVTFTILGFHSVIFPKKGTTVQPLVIPGGPPNRAGVDPAGVPYWWSGQPGLAFNPVVGLPNGGTAVTGAKTVSSGFPNGNPPKFTVSFPKKGVFEVRCGVHPKMKGTVTVLAADAVEPSAAAAARAAAAQKAKDLKFARTNLKNARKPRQDNVVRIGPGNSRGETLAFFPKVKQVAPGTAVTFKMVGVNEFHTVTFGPKAYTDKVERALFAEQRGPDPEGALPTDPPGTPVALTPTTHGNGFLNSGLLLDRGFKTGTRSFTVTFPTPGTYSYFCLVHSNMRGRIAVG